MIVVYKYHLTMTDSQTVLLPVGNKRLYVDKDPAAMVDPASVHGLRLWCAVDPEEVEMENVEVRISGTGHVMIRFDDTHYVGSVMDSPYIWHVFAKPIDNLQGGSN